MDYCKSLRPHQWSKNLLIFIPLIAAHETQTYLYLKALMFFVSLCLCASGTYLWNDFFDLSADKQHPTKCFRPLASGKIPISKALSLGVALIIGGITGAFFLSLESGFSLLLYLTISFSYSLFFKHKLFIDTLLLALLFTFRIFCGGMVTGIPLSPWLLTFAVFFFLCLAIVKRLKELTLTTSSYSRAYKQNDFNVLAAFATSSCLASIIVLAFYIQDDITKSRYTNYNYLWICCVLLTYWLGRIIFLANRGTMNDDPVLFALQDKTSWVIFSIIVTIIKMAVSY